MPIPKLEPGLVISYEYVWRRESLKGSETGMKNRPSCVAMTAIAPDGSPLAIIFPITHSQPREDQAAIEIPDRIKRQLGLDNQRSWIITSEYNLDTWPSPALREIEPQSGKFDYGTLPKVFLYRVQQSIFDEYRNQKVSIVDRTR